MAVKQGLFTRTPPAREVPMILERMLDVQHVNLGATPARQQIHSSPHAQAQLTLIPMTTGRPLDPHLAPSPAVSVLRVARPGGKVQQQAAIQS